MLLSIVIPCHNEQDNIEWFYKDLKQCLETQPFEYEVIYVNDGSEDRTADLLAKLHESDPSHVHVISLSRNFGKEAATSAGLHYAKGDAAILIDGDGQHPVEKIPEIVSIWQENRCDTVIGIRRSNKSEGFVKKYGSILFYKIFNRLSSEQKLIPGTTDFRLLSRAVLDDFKLLDERGRITRGLLDWLGYRKAYFTFTAKERKFGEAGYNFSKLVLLAIDSITSLSFTPLYLSLYIGSFIIIGSVGLFLVMIIEQLALGDPLGWDITGGAYLTVMVLFLAGIILVSQGMMAFYIGKIFNETRARPLYLVDKKESAITTSRKKRTNDQ